MEAVAGPPGQGIEYRLHCRAGDLGCCVRDLEAGNCGCKVAASALDGASHRRLEGILPDLKQAALKNGKCGDE
jgi:hypothetical protein